MKFILKLTLGCRDVLLNKQYYDILDEKENYYLVAPRDSTGEYFTLKKTQIGVPVNCAEGKVYYVYQEEHTPNQSAEVKELEEYLETALDHLKHLINIRNKCNKDIDRLQRMILEASQKLKSVGGLQ